MLPRIDLKQDSLDAHCAQGRCNLIAASYAESPLANALSRTVVGTLVPPLPLRPNSVTVQVLMRGWKKASYRDSLRRRNRRFRRKIGTD